MQLAANDEKPTQSATLGNTFAGHSRDDRLNRARKLLRPSGRSMQANATILAAAGLAGAALLLATLITGVPGAHGGAPLAPESGSDSAPQARGLRAAVPASSTPHADFELSAAPDAATQNVPQEAGPAVRDAVLIGTEGESR